MFTTVTRVVQASPTGQACMDARLRVVCLGALASVAVLFLALLLRPAREFSVPRQGGALGLRAFGKTAALEALRPPHSPPPSRTAVPFLQNRGRPARRSCRGCCADIVYAYSFNLSAVNLCLPTIIPTTPLDYLTMPWPVAHIFTVCRAIEAAARRRAIEATDKESQDLPTQGECSEFRATRLSKRNAAGYFAVTGLRLFVCSRSALLCILWGLGSPVPPVQM